MLLSFLSHWTLSPDPGSGNYDLHGLVVDAVEFPKKVKDSQNPRDPFGFVPADVYAQIIEQKAPALSARFSPDGVARPNSMEWLEHDAKM